MISPIEIQQLVERRPNDHSPVLSLYLNVNQSRTENLNRYFEARFKTMIRSIEQRLQDKKQIQDFAQDAAAISRFLADYAPKGQTLITFSDASDRFFWSREIRVPLVDHIRWSPTPYVLPIAEALDEFERYGIILADRARARLFTVFLGEIEELVGILSPSNMQRARTTGTDHLWSESRFQRRVKEHELWHLKHVAESMEAIADRLSFDRLVLAGVPQATAELRRLLPKRLRSRTIAEISLPFEASLQEVLQASLKADREVERAHERLTVDNLVTSAAKGGQAVVGLENVIDQLHQGRLWWLVYPEGIVTPGWTCRNCSSLFVRQLEKCDFCGGDIAPIGNVVEEIIKQVLGTGGKIEQVQGEPAAVLNRQGGIGGYLRY